MYFGIDVSKWQGLINWSAVARQGIDFAIIKLGGGDGKNESFYEDSNWIKNTNGVNENGLHIGYYFYVGADFWDKKGIETAKYIDNLLHDVSFDMPIYLDVESTPTSKKKETTTQLRLCCEYLENKGYFVGVYGSSISGFRDRFNGNRIKELYTDWVANYSNEPTNYTMWQYSSRGNIEGINGYVDLDQLKTPLWTTIVKGGFNHNLI